MVWFIVTPMDDECRAELLSLAADLGSPNPVAFDSLEALQGCRQFEHARQALVLVAGATDADGVQKFAEANRGRAFLIVLSDRIEPEVYKRLLRTGAAEWISWHNKSLELRDLVTGLGERPAPPHAASVVSFQPSIGGTGSTTLAVECAVHLSRQSGLGRVAILDLHLQGGTVADALDVEPRFGIAEILDHPERLDEQLIDVYTSRHGERLDVFASPLSRVPFERVSSDIVFTIVDMLTTRYAALLIDLPVGWFAWTDGLLLGSDGIVASGGETVPALRRLRSLLAHINSLGVDRDKVATVLGGVETDFVGRPRRRDAVTRALPGRRPIFVRHDVATVRAAHDLGRPLLDLGAGSRLCKEMRGVASWVDTLIRRQKAEASTLTRETR